MTTQMAAARSGPDRFHAVLPALTVALVLLASLLNFLNYNDYPLLRPEVWIVAGLLLLVAALSGIAYGAAGGVPRILLDILIAYLALDLNFDGIGVPITAIVAAVLLNRRLMPALAIVFSVVLLTELIVPNLGSDKVRAHIMAPDAADSEAPALLHLILDEHIGIEGLPRTMPEAEGVRERLKAFYAENGFRLFGAAYSEYLHTVNAIPHILNFGTEQAWAPQHKEGMAIGRNAYFDRLRALGYEIKVHQNDFVDYCASGPIRSCAVSAAAHLGLVAQFTLTAGDKAKVILYGFSWLADLARVTLHLYDTTALRLADYGLDLPIVDFESKRQPSSINALAAMDSLIADLGAARPGEAYFAHVLLPHYPYATRGDCSLKPQSEWLAQASVGVSLKKRQRAYFDQLDCVITKLGDVVDAIAASPAGANSILLVHGDHGSRITNVDPTVENLGDFAESDLLSGYSTLFAIRAPGIAPGYDLARLPVASLLAALAGSGFSAVPAGGREEASIVVLEDQTWRPAKRHPLPATWGK